MLFEAIRLNLMQGLIMINLLEEIGIGSANQGEKMEILNTNGKSLTDIEEDKPFLVLLGKDSDEFRSVEGELQFKLVSARIEDDDYRETAKETTERVNTLMTSCVVGWGNIWNEDMLLDFNPENARYLFDNSPSLVDQANVFIGKRENFLKK
jgi:hypothetical protein